MFYALILKNAFFIIFVIKSLCCTFQPCVKMFWLKKDFYNISGFAFCVLRWNIWLFRRKVFIFVLMSFFACEGEVKLRIIFLLHFLTVKKSDRSVIVFYEIIKGKFEHFWPSAAHDHSQSRINWQVSFRPLAFINFFPIISTQKICHPI